MRMSPLSPVAVLVLTLLISPGDSGSPRQTMSLSAPAAVPTDDKTLDAGIRSTCRYSVGRYGLNIPRRVAGSSYFAAEDLVGSKSTVCLYDKSLDPVIQQFRKALDDSDARWEHEYTGPGLAQKLLQAYKKHGGSFDPQSPSVPQQESTNWPTVHHSWISSQRYFLDLFVKAKGSPVAGPGLVLVGNRSEKAGLVFVGIDARLATDPRDSLSRLKQVDELWKADEEEFLDIMGWSHVVGEQIWNLRRSENATNREEIERRCLEMDLQFSRTTENHKRELDGRMSFYGTSPLWIASDIAEHTDGKIFLYAKTAMGFQSIEELYVGVPTIVEVQFDSPKQEKELPVELAVSGEKLSLKAHRYDQAGYIFRTDAFVPTEQNEKPEPTFNPGQPPKGGSR